MDAATTAQVLTDIQRRSVLVMGDVMLDKFVDGSVSRISPEAPVPVLDKATENLMAGGAANVACNLAALGCEVRLMAISGDDTAGRTLSGLLGSNLAIDYHQIIDKDRPTTTKTRYRANGQQVLRVDEEISEPITEELQDHILSEFTAQLKTSDIVILSDYAKGCIPEPLIAKLIAAARAANTPVIADPKLSNFASYEGVDILTPNLAELHSATLISNDGLESIANAASKLAAQSGISAVLATLSARGMILANADGSWSHAPAHAREVFDVSGAGDTVVAVLAAAIAAGVPAPGAVALANIAAGVVVGKSGTAVVSPGEIITAAAPAMPPTDWHHWSDAAGKWRDAGQKIGFANGCFDLLHPGHIHLLSAAAARGDRLIVGLNSDASVKRLKGEGRPLQTAEQRAAAVMQLPFVDGVTIFEQDTPYDLITELQPDLLFKGGDYAAEDVIGKDVVTARGGEVVIISSLGSHSSSALILD
ncbi:D-glycero-beta-D-manno-heptose-7-phosphate kinase [Alphaproteobacteria bacterium]|nr:D-glycero-beta-D-manno-heptose-7-phosphate kinase [Alphaproteobacteria bacterium]